MPRRLMQALPAQVVAPVLDEPPRPCEVAFVDMPSSIGVALSVYAKNDTDGFLPRGTVIFRVGEPHQQLEMLSVVVCYRRALRRLVEDSGMVHLAHLAIGLTDTSCRACSFL